jgi:hypothetical protein
MKLCKDCKHANGHGYYWSCHRSAEKVANPVHGLTFVIIKTKQCERERERKFFGCGPEGKYWEAK